MQIDRSFFSTTTQVAIEAAKRSGHLLKKGFNTVFTVSSKPGYHNLVTEYDLLSEKMIMEFIKESFPDAFFLCEESGITCEEKEKSDIQWIIDPLDGTVNFAHNIPVFAVSIAAYKKERALCGVIYQPMSDELFIAEAGKGTYLNGKKIVVSSTKDLLQSFLATGFPYNAEEKIDRILACFTKFIQKGVPVRRLGSAALDMAYVAAGRFDGYWETGLGAWDCAAAQVIITEAQGKITHWDGSIFQLQENNNNIVVSNGIIHEEILQHLKENL